MHSLGNDAALDDGLVPAAPDDCPMTEECPAYDREADACRVHAGDCPFRPAPGLGAASDTASVGEARRRGSDDR